MELRKNIILLLKIGLLLIIGVLIAWKANSYYGKREYGQAQLQKIAKSTRISPLFIWEMEHEGEILSEIHDLTDHQFSHGIFSAIAGKDPYFYLNLKDDVVDPVQYYYLAFRLYLPADGIIHIYFWYDKQLTEGGHSAPIPVKAGWNEYRVNLSTIRFSPWPKHEGRIPWGGTLRKVEVLRLDLPENIEGQEVKIDWIQLKRGSTIVLPIAAFSKTESEDINKNYSVLISRPIGIGAIGNFLNITWEGELQGISIQTRTGSSYEIDNSHWESWSHHYRRRRGTPITSSPNKFIQCRLNINKKIWGEQIPIKSVAIRYLDPYPLRENSLIFGTNRLTTFNIKNGLEGLNDYQPGSWARVLMEEEDIYEIANHLAAKDINIVGCFDLEKQDVEEILSSINLFKSQIRCWEFFNLKRLAPAKIIWLIKQIKEIDPHCLILPTRTDHRYFESLALAGLDETIKMTPTPELSLNRGFAWFLVIALIVLIILIGLGKELGYNFKFGIGELKYFSLGLLLIAGLNLPIIRLMGEKIFRLPNWAELSAAIGRYAPSAVIQEFVRALLILIIFKAISTKIKKENRTWAIALLVSSILFSLGHLGYPGLAAVKLQLFLAITFIAGMIFGMVFIKTRSIVATSILHLCSNLLLFTFTLMKI